MKFIIVDNDKSEQKEVREIVLRSTFEKNVEIEVYSKYCRDLINTINENSIPKIFILDIDLGDEKSGIEIAKLIREKDWESYIIFITNHDRMFEVVYRNVLEVFDFIEKFRELEKRLDKDIKSIVSKRFNNKIFYYSNRNVDLQLYMRDITYIERDTSERKSIVHTTNGRFILNLSLAQIKALLDERFKKVHRACLVNTERVVKYKWNEGYFALDTGENVILLSRLYRKAVLEYVKCK